MKRLALDTETTGVDTNHNARVYLVTTCNQDWNIRWWEWEVDPLTRMPNIPIEDVMEISELIRDAEQLIGQNLKFDYHALKRTNPLFVKYWDWNKVQDTLVAGH